MNPLKALSIITIALFIFSCNTPENKKDVTVKNPTNQPKNNYTIGKKNAGDIFVGREMPQKVGSFKLEKKSKKIIEEGAEFIENYYTVSENTELMTCILSDEEGQEHIVKDIIIISDKFKTDKDIGVNSTIESFIKACPDYKIWFSYISKNYVIQSNSMDVQFLLNPDSYIGNNDKLYESDMVILKKEDFKKNAKILKIRLFDF